ncbi:MAG: phosphoenolpyruvate carboxykinase [Turicibacter sp.]
MKPQFELERNTAVINFSAHYCNSEDELLNSQGFERVLTRFLNKLKKKEAPIYEQIVYVCGEENISAELISLFKLLLVLEINEVMQMNRSFTVLLQHKDTLIEFIEELYNYWRSLERYSVIYNSYEGTGIQKIKFIEANNTFTSLVLKVYRTIEERLLGHHQHVYRQLIVGANAGIVLDELQWDIPLDYMGLRYPAFIESIVLTPPFITYPKRTTRDGLFEEVFTNPLDGVYLDPNNWFVYPAKVGTALAYVFFHRDFMAQGITMCNLFELADLDECRDRKPDIIYVYGNKDAEDKAVFYQDKANDIMVGYASYSEDHDYFGYMKKMVLTLYNVKMINQKKLPLHGAMIELTLKNGKQSNIVVIGDSGAGKSETLEALRMIAEDQIKAMKIIFDDMGTLAIENGEIRAYGTEIGAFVRLDDLDTGYAYRTIDRSIFMNPDKVNARIVIPVSTYKDITTGRPVDMFLYANNYEEDSEDFEFFNNVEEAKAVFVRGARKAKGTTTETGLVESYFTNPFGPVQLKDQTDPLIDKYFATLFKKNIKVGQLRTRLAVSGKEHTGPRDAAQKLLAYINEEK